MRARYMKSDLVVMSVNSVHPDVMGHKSYRTLQDIELQKEKREEREDRERNKVKEIAVIELWKPHQQSTQFFKETGNG